MKKLKIKKAKNFKKDLMFGGLSLLSLLISLTAVSFITYSIVNLANAASRTNSSVRCPTNYQPVCGADNKTYSNSCQAGLKGVSVAYEGKCVVKKTDNTTTTCIDHDNGRNYNTASYAEVKLSDGSIQRQDDVCKSDMVGANLLEGICVNGEVVGDPYNCPNGCKDGKCIKLNFFNKVRRILKFW